MHEGVKKSLTIRNNAKGENTTKGCIWHIKHRGWSPSYACVFFPAQSHANCDTVLGNNLGTYEHCCDTVLLG
jgi:hypothetical protein